MEGIFKKQSNDTSGETTDYTQLSNKPKVNGVELTGNKTSEELGITGASLYDIKTLAQAIANKGWACISQDKTIAKSAIPTSSASLQKKLDGVDKSLSWAKISDNGIDTTNEIYSQIIKGKNGWFYCIHSRNCKLGKTKDFTYNSFTDLSDERFDDVWLFEKINEHYALLKGNDRMLLFNLDTETLTTVYTNGGYSLYDLIKIIDGKIFFAHDYDNWAWCNVADIANIATSYILVPFSTAPAPKCKIGNYWFGIKDGAVYRGTEFNNMTSWKGGWEYGIEALFEINSTTLGVVDGWNPRILHYIDIETGNEIKNIDVSNYFGNEGFRPSKGYNVGGIIYAGQNYTADGGYTWVQLPTMGMNCFVNNQIEFVVNRDNNGLAYRGQTVATEYTDIINGVSQVFYYNSSCKMKFAKNTTNKSAIVSVLGYWNYFYIGENSITLPQNNNLWTWLYVGDEFVESSIPSGASTRLLPQTEVITDTTSTSKSFTSTDKLKANADYQFGTITSLTFDTNSVDDTQLETTIRFTAVASFAFSYTNAGVKINGELPTFEEGGEYIILIVNKTIFVSDKIVAGE